MLSKALVVGAYQKKAEELARLPDLRLTVLVPAFWQEAGCRQHLERVYVSNYELRVIPIALNGHFHIHFYPGLTALLRRLHPDIVHVDEEPYNLATVQALRAARQAGARTLFFTWQNIYRRLLPPFNLFESCSLRWSDYGLAGNQEAVAVLRRKGYRGALAVIPQFGVDPQLYRPADEPADRPFTVGYLGRLVEQKGVLLLLQALAGLGGDWRLVLVGTGPYHGQLAAKAAALDIAGRVSFVPAVPSTSVPAVLAGLDVLVLPSLTCPNWKEQFGRVLIEAMACRIAVIGSDSGEIPNVIGAAGVVFPEGDVAALRACLVRQRADPAERRRLGILGRERVLANYTQARIAEQTYHVYRELSTCARRP